MSDEFTDRNRRQLVEELADLRAHVHAYAGGPPAPRTVRPDPVGTPLDHLCEVFDLDDAERQVVLLCAGYELDAAFAEACASAQGGTERARPTLGLALAAVPDADWRHLAPSATLRDFALIQVVASDEIVRSSMRIDEGLLHFLLDGVLLDPELLTYAIPLFPPASAADAERAFAERVVAQWEVATANAPAPLRLEGAHVSARSRLAALIGEAIGGLAYRFEALSLPTTPQTLWDLARRWRRFHGLHGAIAVIDVEDASPEAQRSAERFLELLQAPAVLIGQAQRPLDVPGMLLIRAPVVGAADRIDTWTAALKEALGEAPDPAVAAEFADRFRLPADAIRTVTRACAAENDWRAALMETCRAYGRGRLEGLAECIEPRGASWDRLVLPPDVARPLHEMVEQIRLRDIVQRQWRIGGGLDRGLSTTALFAGPSGVGKTLAAEVVAAELGLDLYRIDLSNVVSKYIGETEKHLARLFDAAEGSGAVLLFDEADALFGKRSEVKDSHDRYANIEVGYLLQRLERYSGVAILTTNLRESIDAAFMRRLRFVVDFPFPDEASRARMWDLWLPEGEPRGDIDPASLGKVALSGGQIFNVAVNAAFLAAADGLRLKADHLLSAIRREYVKTGRALSDSEARGVVAADKRARA